MFSISTSIQKHLCRSFNLFYLSNCKFTACLHYLCIPTNIKLLKYKSFKSIQLYRYDECSSYQTVVSTWKYYQSHNKIFIQSVGRKGAKSTSVCISDGSLQLLCDTFGLEIEECRVFAYFQAFLNCSDNQLSATVEFLHEIGIRAQHINKAPWLLLITKGGYTVEAFLLGPRGAICHLGPECKLGNQSDCVFANSLTVSRNVVEELEKSLPLLLLPNLFNDVMDGIGFLLYNPLLLKKYDKKFGSETHKFPHHKNRIYYIADHLKLKMDSLSLKIVQAWKTLHRSREALDATIDVLSDFKVNPEAIINDIWIFYYSATKMKKRLQLLRERTGSPGKPWVGRCSETTYQRHSSFKKGYKLDIPYGSLSTLLKEELDIDFMPNSLRSRTPHSIFHNITILKNNGFDKDVLRGNLKLLLCCPNRTIARKQILQQNGIQEYLPAFTFTEPKFKKFISEMKNNTTSLN